jgi:hypothetical protein
MGLLAPSYCLPAAAVFAVAAGCIPLLGSAETAVGSRKHGSGARVRRGREVGARKE